MGGARGGRWPLWAGLALLAVACGGPPEGAEAPLPGPEWNPPALSFEEFRERARPIPGAAVFVVDGDTPVESEEELLGFYARHVQQGGLTIHAEKGRDSRWSDAMKTRLTYCVSRGFGTRYASVVRAMQEAAAAWQAAGGIHFVHLLGEDGRCTPLNQKVTFDVRPAPAGTDTTLFAAAFFPHFPRGSRTVWINLRADWKNARPSMTGVLRHEMGHALGFRHEHIRPEAGGACGEPQPWRAVTSYDPYSVMHYPFCNGRGDGRLALTEKDKEGARQIYGRPRAGIPESESESDSADATFDVLTDPELLRPRTNGKNTH